MNPVHPAQFSFSDGEQSKLTLGSKLLGGAPPMSAFRLENMRVTTEGPVSRRRGTKYESTTDGRIFSFLGDVVVFPAPPEGIGIFDRTQVHFSGVLWNDRAINTWTERPHIADDYSTSFGLDTDDYAGPGDYPDNAVAFPRAVATTFDGIAIDYGVRLVIYSGTNFTGSVLLDATGPKIINNSIWGDTFDPGYLSRVWTPFGLNALFPPAVRSLSVGNMHSWSFGSCKIRLPGQPL